MTRRKHDVIGFMAANQPVRERRNQRSNILPTLKPELVATGANV